MHTVLAQELDQVDSAQWSRYMRHKNMEKPQPAGNQWKDHQGNTMTGALVETGASSTSDKSKRLCDQSVKQKHGYFQIKGSKTKNYFFWMFEARSQPEAAPVVLWLTGGPGCSSEIALFTENGPCTVNQDGKSTTKNPFSWNRHANIIFVDQPAGTGFSYGKKKSDYDRNEKAVAEDLYWFMQELVKKYPKYHKQDFFVSGESYAGHFVPATAHRIFKGNQAKTGEYIALKGLMVGNGLTDPEIQYKYYPEMAFKSTTTPKVITKQKYLKMRKWVPKCTALIKKCQSDDTACQRAFTLCNAFLIGPVQDTGVNVYDLRQPCKNPPLCYDMSNIRQYLRSRKVKNTLGVKKSWQSCNFMVNSMFHVDWMKSYAGKIPPMLKNGIRTMIYAGDVDFICNWMGNKAWVTQMAWPGKKSFNDALDKNWVVNGKSVGKERTYGGLSFVQIHRAGHMVPMDQPAMSMIMLDNFLKSKLLVPQ